MLALTAEGYVGVGVLSWGGVGRVRVHWQSVVDS
jgi:hypothetical protein